MSQRDRNPARAKRSVSTSMVLGLLLVPLSAYAASVLISDRAQTEPETPAPVSAPVPTAEIATDFAIQTATAADLAAACGDTGMGMVSAEMEGSISDIQQAALDALREICAEQGMPLPGKPAPEPLTQTVVLADSQPAPSANEGAEVGWEVEYDDDHEDDDEWEDDDHDEDEDDDDHDEGDDD